MPRLSTGGGLDDANVLVVLQKKVRRRQDTIDELQQVNRPKKLAKGKTELAIHKVSCQAFFT